MRGPRSDSDVYFSTFIILRIKEVVPLGINLKQNYVRVLTVGDGRTKPNVHVISCTAAVTIIAHMLYLIDKCCTLITLYCVWRPVTYNVVLYSTCIRVLHETEMNSTVLWQKNKQHLCEHLMQPSLRTPRRLVRPAQITAHREELRVRR